MTKCLPCSRLDGSMAFECIQCCIRWLSKMSREEQTINAPVIEKVMGAAYMEQVRQAWKVKRG